MITDNSTCHHPTSVNLQSHAFLQTYGAILPTSLTYINLLARGCSPWRPAAVIGTTRSGLWTLYPQINFAQEKQRFLRPPSPPNKLREHRYLWFSWIGRASPVWFELRFGLPMKLGCSSGFRALSRGKPNSRALWPHTPLFRACSHPVKVGMSIKEVWMPP